MPAAGVGDRQLDIGAGLKLGIVVDSPLAGAERQRSAFGHRIARIDRQVQHRDLDLGRVGQHRRQVRIEVENLFDARPQHVAKQRPHFLDQRRDIGRLDLQPLDPAERQQLRRKPGAAFRCGKRIGGIVCQPLVADLLGDQVEPADHNGEQIVEVVRDAAGQLAKRFHLLALAKLVLRLDQFGGPLGNLPLELDLGLLGLGDVTRRTDEARQFPIGPEPRLGDRAKPAPLPIVPQVARFQA